MNQVITALKDEATADVSVMAGATTIISGIAGMVQAGIDAALANGATKDELEPLTQVVSDLKANRDALSAAIATVPPAA